MNQKIIESMLRHGIGLDPWFFEKLADTPNFPPHNIVALDANSYQLTLAVAGFQRSELEIVQEGDVLTVSGRKQPEPEKAEYQVLYRGIAFRDFSRQFKIGDHVRVQDADLDHGLLRIKLTRELPEAQRPRVIPISAIN